MKMVGTNRKALQHYDLFDTYEAGMVLEGSEVKSLRQAAVAISDAYAEIRNGEVYLYNLHITPYKFSSGFAKEPKRRRKLLLKKEEIKRLSGLIQQRGHQLIPLKIYFNERGYAKVSLGLCRRKRLYDKKEEMLKREKESQLARMRKVLK